jgi:hypothetical protein
MKLTSQQLRKIITEEVSNVVSEMPVPRIRKAWRDKLDPSDFYVIAPEVEAKLDELNSMTIDLGQTRTRLAVKTLCQDIVNLLEQLK